MAAGGVDGDDETYEWLANAAVRGVDFVTVCVQHSVYVYSSYTRVGTPAVYA